MQKCESRTKRVMSAIIAGMMALQVVAPTISYADILSHRQPLQKAIVILR